MSPAAIFAIVLDLVVLIGGGAFLGWLFYGWMRDSREDEYVSEQWLAEQGQGRRR